MATGEVDLKTLLVHDYKMVQAIAGISRLLVYELDANHHWVTQSLSLFRRLSNITVNLQTLLDTCEPYWADKATAFSKLETVKLWKTAAGLWSALPAEQKRFDEYAARRRRERIMGQTADDGIEIEEEQKIADKAAYDVMLVELETTCTVMLERVDGLPDGLVPPVKAEGEADTEEPASSAEPENERQEAPPETSTEQQS